MFPTEGNVFIAPFMDDTLYLEWMRKASFWCVLQWTQHSTYVLARDYFPPCILYSLNGAVPLMW